MTLSPEDVQDILALLDSLPYDDVTLETSRFSLRLRRAGEGVWAQETQLLAEPVPAGPDPAPEQQPAAPAAAQGPAGTQDPAGTQEPAAAQDPAPGGRAPPARGSPRRAGTGRC